MSRISMKLHHKEIDSSIKCLVVVNLPQIIGETLYLFCGYISILFEGNGVFDDDSSIRYHKMCVIQNVEEVSIRCSN